MSETLPRPRTDTLTSIDEQVSASTAAQLDTLTEPRHDQVGDARMVIIDLLGTAPAWPLAHLIEHVCEAYEAPAGEKLSVDLTSPTAVVDESLRDAPALRHVTWVRASRLALHQLTSSGEVCWSQPSDDPDEVDHPLVEVLLWGGNTEVVTLDVGDRLPDGTVSLT